MIAKTIASKQITKIDKKQITLNLANDAMQPVAYDGDTSTQYYIERGTHYIEVDQSIIGKKVTVCVQYGSSGYCNFAFYNKNKDVIQSYDRRAFSITEQIPEGTKYIGVSSGKNLYEIKPELNLNIEYKVVNSKLTKNGIERGHYIIKLNESGVKSYSLDNKNWNDYNNEIIAPLNGQDITIYVKFEGYSFGLDYKIENYNSIDESAYDGDITTGYNGNNNWRYLDLDSDLAGKNLKIIAGALSAEYCFGNIQIIDKDEKVLYESGWNTYDGGYETTIKIPEDADKLRINSQTNTKIYEISIED